MNDMELDCLIEQSESNTAYSVLMNVIDINVLN
jgi:hypothetical protein